ncbi:hypothetical protein [Mucilaginibacter humi]|uniref:hypothetical protein n=1 Tax=Mucilaginibacter humi TaxID=2732510 RepID=UPI00293BB8F3|nr:hypothetical protein [Mucilaginibacter humi]
MEIYRVPVVLAGSLIKPQQSRAQAQEMQQLILDIEKLTQLKGILSDMKTGYQIYQQGYGSISQLSKGNFDLHSVYLNGLFSINPAVKNYGRVAEILTQQASLVSEYKTAYTRFRQSGTFNANELSYMSEVYTQLISQSLQNLDELTNVLTAGKLRMTDDERLRAIDRIYASSSDKLQFLRYFNRQGILLSIQRTRGQRRHSNAQAALWHKQLIPNTMKKKIFLTAIFAVTGIAFPLFSKADGLATDIRGLQGTLNSVYNDMLPMCSQLIGVGRAIAGFGALWYIGSRVWRQIASAEPIDFYPLMRPFGLGLAILLFPTVIAVINGIMSPTVTATGGMVQNSDAAIAALLKAKDAAVEKTESGRCMLAIMVPGTAINGTSTRIRTIDSIKMKI